MSEQAFWHIAAICIYLLSLFRLRKGFIDSTSWFCLFFAIGFSGNVLGYPLAVLDDPVFTWMRETQGLTLHGKILFTAMVAAWTGHLLVRKKMAMNHWFHKLPSLSISPIKLDRAFRSIAVAGAISIFILIAFGFYGYFINRAYLHNPPAWLDFIKSILAVSNGLLFLVVLTEFQVKTRLGTRTVFLLMLWIMAGFLSGFKTMVVLPGLFLVVSSWIAGRFRLRYVFVMCLLIVMAYSIIEPMRVAKRQSESLTAFDAITLVTSSDDFVLMESGTVIDRFFQRIDYTRTAVSTLTEYERGHLKEFKRRVDEYFKLAPIIAVVPRFLWPSKPLANLGGVLSFELTGNNRSAVTPSSIVITYIWGGWFGLILVSFAWSVLCTMGGQIVFKNKNSIYKHAPLILLAIVLSLSPAVMASYLIAVIRMAIIVLILIQLRVLRVPRATNISSARNHNSFDTSRNR